MDNDKDSNSVQQMQIEACSPLTIRDTDYNYSPSPSTTKNDTPSTANTSNNTSIANRTPTPEPNRTPNPLPTLPANNNIIKLEQHLTFQPLLTSINHNINSIHHNKENTASVINRNIPRIPLPNMMPKDMLSLPQIPNISCNNNNKGANRKNTQNSSSEPHHATKRRRRPQPIKMEMMTTRSRSRSRSIASAPISSEQHDSSSYNVITSAFNHNLKVKQEHLREDVVTDTLFESCYIFSMRCPYTDCCQLFDDMPSYQNHHIQCHQLRDKKGKLIQTKEAKWKCPDCGKISASWYNYAAHVTMHKDSCDAPWICKLPPINKKKYIQWTDGTFICGKRCSTKHNLIKHLKALHTSHRIIDLSQSVKAQAAHKRNNDRSSYAAQHRRRSPRKRRKRPCFNNNNNNNNSISPTSASSTEVNAMHNNSFIHAPPHKKIKMDPDSMHFDCMHSNALPIYQTQSNINNWSINKQGQESNEGELSPHKSVRQQSDFVGLLLEAAQLMEVENKSKESKSKSQTPPNHNSNCVTSIANVDALLSSIKTLFHSSAQNLASPASIDNLTQLSAMLAMRGTTMKDNNDNNDNNNNDAAPTINISNITNISNVSIPSHTMNTINTINANEQQRIMPDIAIVPNMPSMPMKLSAITASNPAISLPKMPLPPPPPNSNASESQNVQHLLKILNYPSTHNKYMLNGNALNMFNSYSNRIPLIPNIAPINVAVANKEGNNTLIANNFLASLPPIHMFQRDAN